MLTPDPRPAFAQTENSKGRATRHEIERKKFQEDMDCVSLGFPAGENDLSSV